MESKNTTNQQEEVDLGKLFQMIGNGFSKLFKAIGNLFKSIFHYFILLLIFFRKYAIILGAAMLIGGVLGYFLDRNKPKSFESKMIAELNFGSGHEVYKQNNFLNSLIKNKEYDKISKILNISEEESKSLMLFSAKPYNVEKSLLREYDFYIQHTDTIYTRELTVDKFKKRYSDADYRKQEIRIIGLDKNVFVKLNDAYKKLIENKHYTELLNLKTTELDNRRSILVKNLQTIDSIRKRYEKVELLNAQKEKISSTSINLSEKANSRNRDIDLFQQTNQILNRLRSVDNERIRSGFIMSILSEFKDGNIYNPILKRKWFLYALFFSLITSLVIIGKKVNIYLNNYTKK